MMLMDKVLCFLKSTMNHTMLIIISGCNINNNKSYTTPNRSRISSFKNCSCTVKILKSHVASESRQGSFINSPHNSIQRGAFYKRQNREGFT